MTASRRALTRSPHGAVQGQAARWLAMGFGMYAVTVFAAKVNDKASSVPFTPRVYPFDNLRVELGGEPQ